MRATYTFDQISAEVIRAYEPVAPEKILLFGSVARGRWDDASDVDVIIVYRTDKRFLDRLEELYLLWPLPVALDLLAYPPEEFDDMLGWNAFLQDIVAEGKTIYERAAA